MDQQDIASRRSVLGFFALALGCSWGIWIPTLVLLSGTFQFLGVVVGGFGPPVAGAIMTYASGRSLRRWVRDMMVWRVSARWYAVALGFPILLAILAGTGAWAFGSEFDWGILPQRVGFYLGTFLFVMILGGGQEEFGWRGYALPRLQRRYTALTASLIIGVIWACWHLPLLISESNLYANGPIGIYLLFVIAISVVFTWLYNNSHGSVFLSILLHAGMNSASILIPLPVDASQTVEGTTVLFTVQTAGLWVVAAVLVAYYGHKTLTPRTDLDRATTGS